MGYSIWTQIVSQNAGEKFRPCALSVSNKQSRALSTSAGIRVSVIWRKLYLQSAYLQVLARHDDLVESVQHRQPVLHHWLLGRLRLALVDCT